MTSSLTTTNYSFTAVPLAWALCLTPHVYALVSYERYLKSQPREIKDKYPMQRHQPRTLLTFLANNPTIPKAYRDRLFRAHSASLNGYENLGFFAAAVVAANLGLFAKGVGAGSELWKLNVLSLGNCVSRAAFCLAYTLGVSGPHRGVYFYTGVGICVYLFQMAGKAMAEFAAKKTM
jgi:uncharacterized MAPEG superfamily protein